MTEKRNSAKALIVPDQLEDAGLSQRGRQTGPGSPKAGRQTRPLPEERTITLHLNEEELLSFQASPENLDELAVGFLYSEGVLNNREDLGSVQVTDCHVYVVANTDRAALPTANGAKKTLTSGCGRGLTFLGLDGMRSLRRTREKLTVSVRQVGELMRELAQQSTKYQKTGGVHSSALALPDKIIATREDIGRHNTVDKLLGYAFLNDLRLQRVIIVSSGRISLEMAAKVGRAGIPVAISRTAVTDMALALADELGITLVGYARAGANADMRVYCGGWRLNKEIRE